MSVRSGPANGPRFRIVLTVVGLAVALCATSAPALAKAKRCPAGQITSTIAYVHHTGGPADHATGCVARTPTAPRTFAGIEAKLRALTLSLATAKVRRAFRTRAARRVAAIDAKTDAYIAALVAADAKTRAPAASRRHGPRAAAGTGPDTVTNDNGTVTRRLTHVENLDTADDLGDASEWDATTSPTRVTGHNSAKNTVTAAITHVVKRCPDADGIERGTIHFSLRQQSQSATVIMDSTSVFDAQLVGHFDDNAHLASVDVIGTWSYKNRSRSVSGTVSSGGVSENGDGYRTLNVNTTTTKGSDDAVVLGGRVTALWVTGLADDYVQQMVNNMSAKGCVLIVPNAATVHVTAGGTVAIVAHLTDRHNVTFAGRIKQFNPLNRVTPPEAQGSPDATFTYTAPSSAKPGDTDVVQLSHVSKRGTGIGGLVNVVVDAITLPQQFTGTWTRVITFVTGVTYTMTIDGTATFELDPFFPASYGTFTSLPYEVVSGAITWKITADTCSASGQAGVDMTNATRLTLEDVTTNPAAPQPEPQPFYYAIRAHGVDPLPSYDFSACGLSGGNLSPLYFDIGYGSPFGPGAPADQIVKSSNPNQLSGHLVHSDAGLDLDDTWNFAGSG